MSESAAEPPGEGGEFAEVDISFEGGMEKEILKVVVDALNNQGYPGLSPSSLRENLSHQSAAIEMLQECRPLPVILSMIEKIKQGQI